MSTILMEKHSYFLSGCDELLSRSLRLEAPLNCGLTRNSCFDKSRSRAIRPLVDEIDESIKRAGNMTGADHSEMNFDRLFPYAAGHIAPRYFALARTQWKGICSAFTKDSQRVRAECDHYDPCAAIRAPTTLSGEIA